MEEAGGQWVVSLEDCGWAAGVTSGGKKVVLVEDCQERVVSIEDYQQV